jgi:hypothetical protein
MQLKRWNAMVPYEAAGLLFVELGDVTLFIVEATIPFRDRACLTKWTKGSY